MAGSVPPGFQVVGLEHLLSIDCMHSTLAQELENLALRFWIDNHFCLSGPCFLNCNVETMMVTERTRF